MNIIMMRKILFLIFSLFPLGSLAVNTDGILFEISGNGMKAPSYILGSFHFIRGEFVHKIPSYDEIYRKITQVCFETDMDSVPNGIEEHTDGAMGLKMDTKLSPTQILLPADSSYASVIGEEKAHLIDSVMKTVFPMYVENMRPGYAKMLANAIYSIKLFDLNAQNIQQPFEGIDYYVYNCATRDKKIIQRLEPIAVQDSILKNLLAKKTESSQPHSLKDEMLAFYDYCKGYNEMVNKTVLLRNKYQAGQGEGVIEILKNNEGLSQTEDKKVKERNANWMKLIPKLMKAKSTLFVVGLAHVLPYKDSNGLLSDLEKMGYSIKVIK